MYSLILTIALGLGAEAPAQLPSTNCHGRTSFYTPPALRDPVLYWNEVTLQAIRQAKTPPPVAARNLAMVHVAIQEAVNRITLAQQPYLVNDLQGSGASAEAAVTSAAQRVLRSLYPDQSEALEQALTAALAVIPESDSRAVGLDLGRTVAERVLAWRANDGSERSVFYRARQGPDFWQPTPPEHRPPLAPHWGHVKTFAMRQPADFRPPPPPTCNTKEFAQSLEEVKFLGGVNSFERTRDQTEIALFWADGEGTVTPPGHWNRIAQAVAETRRLSLVENARLFALLNIALADAAILCWDAKFLYDYVRPVTAIRRADHDGNPDTWSDPSWTPLLSTPPFPSYTSGHSTFSAAAATVLAQVLGDETRFSIGCDDLPNVTRSYSRFSSAAAEAGRSRIYGGIHYDFDDREGQKSGAALGQFVARYFWQPVNGAGRSR